VATGIPGPGTVYTYNLAAEHTSRLSPLGNARDAAFAVAPSGDRLALLDNLEDTGGSGWILWVASAPDWEPVATVPYALDELGKWPRRGPCLAWSPDGTRLAWSKGPLLDITRLGTSIELCVVHLKQIALAMLMFAQDYDMRLPRPEDARQKGVVDLDIGVNEWWPKAIYWYVKNKDVLRCPKAPEGETGYVFPKELWGENLFAIEKRAETPLVYDAEPRHDGRRCVAYCDRHVKVLTDCDP